MTTDNLNYKPALLYCLNQWRI